MKLASLEPSRVRAALWAYRATQHANREVEQKGIEGADLPTVPSLPPDAIGGVLGVLRRTKATCLTQALVLQAWHASQGDERDLVIGVTAPSGGFRAHAWLEGDPPCHEGFEELTRRAYR